MSSPPSAVKSKIVVSHLSVSRVHRRPIAGRAIMHSAHSILVHWYCKQSSVSAPAFLPLVCRSMLIAFSASSLKRVSAHPDLVCGSLRQSAPPPRASTPCFKTPVWSLDSLLLQRPTRHTKHLPPASMLRAAVHLSGARTTSWARVGATDLTCALRVPSDAPPICQSESLSRRRKDMPGLVAAE